jgi:uncharacterized protein (TIGR00725 family)
MKLIGVIGGSRCSSEEYHVAEQVGTLIARGGAALICGGKEGVMEAACRGASTENGLTIGILPSDDIAEANRFVTIPIATGMGIGRNIIIVRTAQVLIAVDGQYGTLSEIAYAKQLNKQVIALKPWLEIPGVQVVDTPQQAVELAYSSIN